MKSNLIVNKKYFQIIILIKIKEKKSNIYRNVSLVYFKKEK